MRSRLSSSAVAVLVLCMAGIAIAAYLTTVHYASVPLVCARTGTIDCTRVLHSRYASAGGVPTSLWGVAWFVVMAGIAVVRLRSLVAVGWAIVGFGTVLWLVYVELARLDAICLWCTVTHVLVVAIVAIVLVAATAPEAPVDV